MPGSQPGGCRQQDGTCRPQHRPHDMGTGTVMLLPASHLVAAHGHLVRATGHSVQQ